MATAVKTPQESLENLRAIRNTPGMDKFNVRRTEAAIKSLEAQIAGKSYNYEKAVNKISNDEKNFNLSRVELYNKDIEAAKASGKTREMENLQRDMKRFQERIVDQQNAVVAIQTEQSNYRAVLNNIGVKTSALSGISLNETAKAMAAQSLASNNEISSLTEQQSRTAYQVKQAARQVDPMATVATDANALRAAGASANQSAAYAAAKATRLSARKDWDAAMQSGNKAAQAAAQSAWVAAKDAEQVVGQAAVAAAAAASVASEVAQEVAAVAQEVAAVAQEAAQDIQDTVQDTQQAALDALWSLEQLPGSTGTHTFEVTAAIRQMQAEMNGNEFNYAGASSYEEAMENIRNGVNPADHGDPNRMGPCGKPSC